MESQAGMAQPLCESCTQFAFNLAFFVRILALRLSFRFQCVVSQRCLSLDDSRDVGLDMTAPQFMTCKGMRDGLCLQMFKEEACLPIDLELANWWSCTYPKARFTSQFFVARVVGQGWFRWTSVWLHKLRRVSLGEAQRPS